MHAGDDDILTVVLVWIFFKYWYNSSPQSSLSISSKQLSIAKADNVTASVAQCVML